MLSQSASCYPTNVASVLDDPINPAALNPAAQNVQIIGLSKPICILLQVDATLTSLHKCNNAMEGVISHYNILLLDALDTVVGSRPCDAATDEAALAAARPWLGAVQAVEDTAASSGKAPDDF